MKRTVKHRLSLILFVLCYCIGNLISPIYADTLGGFSELLEQRENRSDVIAPVKASVDDFIDVKENDWFYKNLKFLVDSGLINGKTSTTFEPNGSFSYAECSAVIVRYLGLEDEANKRLLQIKERNPDMKNLWYAGYFEVLGNLGLFLDYNIFELEDGLIFSIDKAVADSPIERYRFAESISKSFETNGSIKAKNVFSEYGGCGREFIVGGMYKQDILVQYQEKILDFESIPQESREYILKAYYNGIFSGDISGNFYPHNNLTRAEMAKVLSCICDYNLRQRLIEDGYGEAVTQSMVHTDDLGVMTLDYDVWTDILEKEADNIALFDGCIEYTPSGNAPFGYAIDAYFYAPYGNEYKMCKEWSLRQRDKNTLTVDGNDFKILLVMRNALQGSRPEGVYEMVITDGDVVSSKPNIRQT